VKKYLFNGFFKSDMEIGVSLALRNL